MSNYVENKKKLEAIRNKVGEPLFRMALTHTFDVGFRHLTEENIEATCNEIMQEEELPNVFMTNAYKCDIVRTAGEIAKVPPYDVEIYVNREMEYSAGEDYVQRNRLVRLLQNALNYIYEDVQDCTDFCRIMDKDIGLYEEEIKELGFDWAMDYIEEEE